MNGLAFVIRHLDAHGALSGHTLDEDALGAHGEAKVIGEPGHARILHARLGLELVGCDHRAGIDLYYLAAHVELAALLNQDLGFFAQFVFADGLGSAAGVEQRAGRQLEPADVARSHRGGADIGVGAFVDGNAGCIHRLRRLGRRRRGPRRLGRSHFSHRCRVCGSGFRYRVGGRSGCRPYLRRDGASRFGKGLRGGGSAWSHGRSGRRGILAYWNDRRSG